MIASATVATAWAIVVPVTDWVAAHDVNQLTRRQQIQELQSAREAVRTQLLTLGAGVFAAGALLYTAQNFRLSRRTFELTEQGQVTDRYTKAIEQLGSTELDVRIGAIYSLERISHDSVRDHPTVMEILAAFIRQNSRKSIEDLTQAKTLEAAGTRPDVQAAAVVIGRRDPARDRPFAVIDLHGALLVGANLAGSHLATANLSLADLTGADLTGANLRSADLTGADLTDASLAGADLTGADLPAAILTTADLTAADLTDADLTDADLSGAYVAEAFGLTH